MRRSLHFLSLLGWILGISVALGGEYQRFEYRGGLYHLYKSDPAALSLHWKDETGAPYRTFARLQESLRRDGKRASFLINAGIFEPGGTPTGLHLQEGKALRPLNLDSGDGNFYLKPNGVFGVDQEGKAFLVESTTFARANLQPRLALQSGPLLLREGQVHPAFRIGSQNLFHRNGVGIRSDGSVLFIMTDLDSGTRINLYYFALLFRKLDCQNALFLDGDLSLMMVAPDRPILSAEDAATRELAPGVPAGHEFGAILAIIEDLP